MKILLLRRAGAYFCVNSDFWKFCVHMQFNYMFYVFTLLQMGIIMRPTAKVHTEKEVPISAQYIEIVRLSNFHVLSPKGMYKEV